MSCGPVIAGFADNISDTEPDLSLPVKNTSHKDIVYDWIRYKYLILI